MKVRLGYIFLFFLLFVPLDVYATNDISINCDKSKLNINEETNCSLSINNLNFIAIDISGSLELGSNLSIVESSYNKEVWLSLDSVFDIKNINLIRHNNTLETNLTVATFKIKSSGNATGTSSIRFNNVLVGNSDYQSISLKCEPLNIYFGNNVNTLSSLEVLGYDIDFSTEKTSYSLNVDSEYIIINATSFDSNATIKGIGKKSVDYGNNKYDIVVLAENGLEKKYTINVNRNDNRSSINNLSKISLNDDEIYFDKDVIDYIINVDNDIDYVKITYDLEDSNSKAELIGDSNLSYGENFFVIKVTAENGNVKEYKITVIREESLDLKEDFYINVIGCDIEFDKNKHEYTVKTNNKKINFKVIKDENIVNYVILGNDNLKDGSVVWVITTEKEGKISKYKFNIETIEENDKIESRGFCSFVLIISLIINIGLIILIVVKRKVLFNNNGQ